MNDSKSANELLDRLIQIEKENAILRYELDKEREYRERYTTWEENMAAAAKQIRDTIRECEAMQKQMEETCWMLEEETRKNCELMLETSKKEAESCWDILSERMDTYSEQQEELKKKMKKTPLWFF